MHIFDSFILMLVDVIILNYLILLITFLISYSISLNNPYPLFDVTSYLFIIIILLTIKIKYLQKSLKSYTLFKL
jgi:hypothetical protein